MRIEIGQFIGMRARMMLVVVGRMCRRGRIYIRRRMNTVISAAAMIGLLDIVELGIGIRIGIGAELAM
jgi:hypothetical protein